MATKKTVDADATIVDESLETMSADAQSEAQVTDVDIDILETDEQRIERETKAEAIKQAEDEVARLFEEAQVQIAEEERIRWLATEEQIELADWTVPEAIGILQYAISKSKHFNKEKLESTVADIENIYHAQ